METFVPDAPSLPGAAVRGILSVESYIQPNCARKQDYQHSKRDNALFCEFESVLFHFLSSMFNSDVGFFKAFAAF